MTQPLKAWVVFTGKTDIRWLRFLKEGFRHCFVMLYDGQQWISIDPLSHYTQVEIHRDLPKDFSLPDWLETQGYKAVCAKIDDSKTKAAPLMMCSCVELTKRLLGIHKRTILTPWQLYHYLHQNSYRKDTI